MKTNVLVLFLSQIKQSNDYKRFYHQKKDNTNNNNNNTNRFLKNELEKQIDKTLENLM